MLATSDVRVKLATMLYRPLHDRMWDTWLVFHDDLYWLFYIRIAKGHKGLWNGVSLARSEDLLHWTEIGPVLEKHPDAIWLGTGMIVKLADRFVMNFSEERPAKHGVICFAESTDLLNWRRMDVEFRADARWYETEPEQSAEPLPRWDSLGIVRATEPGTFPYIAFLTANSREGPRGCSAVLGLAESDDAIHWRCLPPASVSGYFPNFEVPEYVRFGNRHYVLFSTNSHAANRFDPHAISNSGGTYYVTSDRMTGPYVPPPGDALLQGMRTEKQLFNLYVGRPFALPDGGYLYYHHWASAHEPPNAWTGPPKILVEREPGRLGLDYWPGTERLKAKHLGCGVGEKELVPVKSAGFLPVVKWSVKDGNVHAEHDGGTHASSWELPANQPVSTDSAVDLQDGRIFEASVRIDEGRGLGVWFGTNRPDGRFCVHLNALRQEVEFLHVMQALGLSLSVERVAAVAWPITLGKARFLRILVRREFMEVYIDDRYVHGQVMAEGFDPSRLGFFCEIACGVFQQPTLWQMG